MVESSQPRFAPEAYRFLFEALEHTIQLKGKADAQGADRHLSGGDLLEGLRDYAARMFGPLAAQVWRSWGVHTTLDWGRIVFKLVEEKKLNRQESDSIDDFRDGFDFDRAFVDSYRVELPGRIEEGGS